MRPHDKFDGQAPRPGMLPSGEYLAQFDEADVRHRIGRIHYYSDLTILSRRYKRKKHKNKSRLSSIAVDIAIVDVAFMVGRRLRK